MEDEEYTDFRATRNETLQDKISQLLRKLNSGIESVVKELGGSPLVIDDDRFFIAKKFLLISYLIGELNIILVTVWRYTEKTAQSVLYPHVIAALEELEGVWKDKDALVQSDIVLSSYHMKTRLQKCYEFFHSFDSVLEKRISSVTEVTPFEIKLIDVLTCSPTADYRLSVISPSEVAKCCCSLEAVFNLRNIKCLYNVPQEVSCSSSELNDQSKIMAYVRDAVRTDNVVYYQNIINHIETAEVDYNFRKNDGETQKAKFEILSEKYNALLRELFRVPTYIPCETELEGEVFDQDIFSREKLSEDQPGLTVELFIPFVSLEQLPLIIQNHSPKFNDDTVTRDEQDYVVDKLTLYSRTFNRLPRPLVELVINFDQGSVGPSQVVFKATYDRRRRFRIYREEGCWALS